MIEWLRFVLILSVTVIDDAHADDRPLVQHDPRLHPLPASLDRARQAARRYGGGVGLNRRAAAARASRSPRYLARRALESARRRTRRPWAYVYPRLLTERALLSALGAPDVDRVVGRPRARSRSSFRAAERRSVGRRGFSRSYPDSRDAIVQAADAVLRHEFDLLGSGPRPLGTPLPWHTDFKTGREWPLDILHRHRIQRARPADRREGAVGAEPLPALHALGQAYWLTGDERYAAEFVAETTDWIDANPFSLRRELGLRDGRRAARGQLDLGLPLLRRSRRVPRPRVPAPLPPRAVPARRVHRQAPRESRPQRQSLPVRRRRPRLPRLLLQARAAGRALARARPRDRRAGNLRRRRRRTASTSSSRPRITGSCSRRFSPATCCCAQHGEDRAGRVLARLERMCEFVAGVHQAERPGAAHRRRRRWPRSDARARRRSTTTGTCCRRAAVAVRPRRLQGGGRPMLGRNVLAARPGRAAIASRSCRTDAPPPRSAAFPRRRLLRAAQPDGASSSSTAARSGCGGRGGHGHNDILSFELFLNGFNVVTDCGAYLYTASREWRNRFRSTAFHNTRAGRRRRAEPVSSAPDALWQLHVRREAGRAALRAGDAASTAFRGGHSRLRAAGAARVARAERASSTSSGRACSFAIGSTAPATHALVWRFHLDPAVDAGVDGCDVRLSRGEQRASGCCPTMRPPAFSLRSRTAGCRRATASRCRRRCSSGEARSRLPIDAVVSVCGASPVA